MFCKSKTADCSNFKFGMNLFLIYFVSAMLGVVIAVVICRYLECRSVFQFAWIFGIGSLFLVFGLGLGRKYSERVRPKGKKHLEKALGEKKHLGTPTKLK